MKLAVRYYSRSGNTKKVAEAIAKATGVEAHECAAQLSEPVDLLFLGGSVYWGGVDTNLKLFIEQLDPGKVKCVAVFGTAALKKEPDRETEKLLRKRGISVSNHSFHCRGAFSVLHKGHPDNDDLQQAAIFALKATEELR